MTPEEIQAVAEAVAGQLNTLPLELKRLLRMDTTQWMDLNHIASVPGYAPSVRFQFTDRGVWVEWLTASGQVLSMQVFTWAAER